MPEEKFISGEAKEIQSLTARVVELEWKLKEVIESVTGYMAMQDDNWKAHVIEHECQHNVHLGEHH